MSQQNEITKTKKTRFSKKRLIREGEEADRKLRAAIAAKYAAENSGPSRSQRSNKSASRPSKKQRPEASAQTDRHAPTPQATPAGEDVDSFSPSRVNESSKHYEDQRSLLLDWDREKDSLLKSYFLSFAGGRSPDARQTEVSMLPTCQKCTVTSETQVKVYFLNRHCFIPVKHCSCCTLAEALVQMQLMPKSIKAPRTAVHFGLLDFFQQLELSSQVSCGALAGVLNWMNAKDGSPVISESALNDTRVYYQRFVLYAKQFLLEHYHVDNAVDICLACEASNVKAYMMDANFSLKRLMRKTELEAFRVFEEERVWVTEEEVALAAQQENKGKAKDIGVCPIMADSNIKAASGMQVLKRKGFAANGLFAMLCTHGMVNKFADVSAGETHSLALACLKKEVSENTGMKPYFITYDIMCKISNSVKRLIPDEVVDESQFALPVLHCYGHKMHCQVEYSPRYLTGFGLTDGEGIERFWSYLGEFTKLTRGMTKSNRKMTLLTAAKHFGAQKMESLGEHLYEQYLKAASIIDAANEEIGEASEQNLMDTWNTFRQGLLSKSSSKHVYLASCMKYLEAEKQLLDYYREQRNDPALLVEVKSIMEAELRVMMAEERQLRQLDAIHIRPTSLNDRRFEGLQFKLMKEEKAELLMIICISVYIVKALRPLLKGRRGKAGVNVTKRLDEQIKAEWKKAETAIEAYNKVVEEQRQGPQLPSLNAIVNRGPISEEQKNLLYEGTDTKTLSLFMKLRALEELEYVKTVAFKLKSIQRKRESKYKEALLNLTAQIEVETSEIQKAHLLGVRCVIESMKGKEVEWFSKTFDFLKNIPSATQLSPSAPL